MLGAEFAGDLEWFYSFETKPKILGDNPQKMNPTFLLPILIILASCNAPPNPVQTHPNPNIWVTAYYASWMQNHLSPDKIDYGAVTHIIHFSIRPNADGTLNTGGFSEQAQIPATVQAVHGAGRKILIAVGGWWCRDVFEGAMNSSNRQGFINNLVSFMVDNGYDGIDIDMEDIQPQNTADYIDFIKALRRRLDDIQPRPILTAFVGWELSMFAQLTNEFDQLNLGSYDMSGAWPGWVTWHNSPIYNGGFTFPNGKPLPSIEGNVNRMMALGVPADKIGIGIDFYGYVWSGGDGTPTGGATEPTQRWSTPPSVQANVPYSVIMDTYYERAYLKWDSLAQASVSQHRQAGFVRRQIHLL